MYILYTVFFFSSTVHLYSLCPRHRGPRIGHYARARTSLSVLSLPSLLTLSPALSLALIFSLPRPAPHSFWRARARAPSLRRRSYRCYTAQNHWAVPI